MEIDIPKIDKIIIYHNYATLIINDSRLFYNSLDFMSVSLIVSIYWKTFLVKE